MNNRTYPYTAWVLQPSFRLKQVEFVKHYLSWGSEDFGDVTDAGKRYGLPDIHQTKKAAIEYGRAQLEKQLNDLAKRQLSFAKRKEELDKAEAKL